MYLKGLGQSEFGDQLPAIPTGFDSPSAYGDGANYGYEVPYDADWGDAAVWNESLPAQTYPSPSSQTGPTSNFDWTGLLSTAIKTWGQIETVKTQAQTQQKVAPYQYRYPSTVPPGVTPYPSSPFSPFTTTTGTPGTLFGIPLTYWLIGGAAVVAAVMLKG